MRRVTAPRQRQSAAFLGRVRCTCQQIKSVSVIHSRLQVSTTEAAPTVTVGGEKTDRQLGDKNNEAGALTPGQARLLCKVMATVTL